MSMTGKERAALRAEAQSLRALVHIGQHGMTPAVVQTLDDALRTKELVKVQLGRPVDIPPRQAATELSEATGSEVVQVIGKTATFFRENPDLPRRKGDLPPWRR